MEVSSGRRMVCAAAIDGAPNKPAKRDGGKNCRMHREVRFFLTGKKYLFNIPLKNVKIYKKGRLSDSPCNSKDSLAVSFKGHFGLSSFFDEE